MYDNIGTCEYFNLSDIPEISSKNELFLTHLNIRSLLKNFDDFCRFLSQLPVIPHIICLSETKIKDMPLINISLPGLLFMHLNSPNNAGGVGIYCTYLTLVIISKLFLTTYMYTGVRIYGYQSRIWLLNMGC